VIENAWPKAPANAAKPLAAVKWVMRRHWLEQTFVA